MKRLSVVSLALLYVIVGVQPVLAAVRSWEMDKAHSNFYFEVEHIYSKIRGQFNEYTGEVRFDPNNLAESKFLFKIETASVDTKIAKRDKHLQSADFFDAGKYPQMTFESTKITATGNGVYEVLGKFTVKGEEYQLRLPLKFSGVKDHPAVKGKEVVGFNGKVTIDRLAYKVGGGKFFDLGVVGKDVEIFVSIEALAEK
ncbi:MAG: YceI family protein [Proteobacteria bacterium]|nr:YceI family protein [Pseudomonadota bacterium]